MNMFPSKSSLRVLSSNNKFFVKLPLMKKRINVFCFCCNFQNCKLRIFCWAVWCSSEVSKLLVCLEVFLKFCSFGFRKVFAAVTEFGNQKLESLNPICAMFKDNKQVELNLSMWDSAENTRREKSRFFKAICPSQRQSPRRVLYTKGVLKRCSWNFELKVFFFFLKKETLTHLQQLPTTASAKLITGIYRGWEECHHT